MDQVNTDDIPQLLYRLQREGVQTNELNDWRAMKIAAMLLGTESGAVYLVEPIHDQPSYVTRLAETPPYNDIYRLPPSVMVIRRQGNPDSNLAVGKRVDIYGLSVKGVKFDPDSIYRTTPLVEIRYLEGES